MATLLHEIGEGAILGAEVRNIHGQVLLAAGLRLQSAHLRTLRMWGVQAVVLQDEIHQRQKSDPLSREQIDALAVQQRRRFLHCDLGHPAVHQLLLLSLHRQMQAQLKEKSQDAEH